MCVWERERERECVGENVCGRERACVWERESVCVGESVCGVECV